MRKWRVMKVTLLAVLGVAGALEAGGIPTVNASDCSLVFRYKKLYYSGCTDADSEGTPWCLLKKPIEGKQWGYCNLSTIQIYIAEDHGVRRDCEISTPVKGGASVFGCYSADDQNTYSCVSGGKELPCSMGSGEFRKHPVEMRVLNNTTPRIRNNATLPDMNAASRADDQLSMQIIVILSILFGLALVCVVVLAAVRRSRNRASLQQLEAKLGAQTSHDYLITKAGSTTSFIPKPRLSASISRSEYTVVTIFTPTLSDELVIRPGDKVVVYKEYDDGWVQGANLTRGGAKGVFPKHCIQPLSDLSSKSRPSSSKRSSSNVSSFKPN
ncbi:hypothetical protein DSO57_1036147 [Entomophthora muscae]|uniref:Uncharacterized protein n=1 Tax=Entomophthora muscae TaxID=34485 RepID=A0ACC2U951_9FUNG|nr:hypothetical protein DSO57_1036147 [Entomophthora muscae]